MEPPIQLRDRRGGSPHRAFPVPNELWPLTLTGRDLLELFGRGAVEAGATWDCPSATKRKVLGPRLCQVSHQATVWPR